MKQYLLMINESSLQALQHVFPALNFLEVQGMTMAGNDNLKVLVNPVPPTVETVGEIPAQPKMEAA